MKFDDAVSIILDLEKGYVNNPNDPGGETNFGISKRSYPNVDIKNLTVDAAKDIYKKDYWDKCKIDFLPSYLRLAVFDASIIQGPEVAIGLLQAALGVKVDGDLGPATLGAVAKANKEKLLLQYIERRWDRMSRGRAFVHFAEGWGNRLFKIILTSGIRLNDIEVTLG